MSGMDALNTVSCAQFCVLCASSVRIFFFFFGLMLIGTSIRVTQKKKSGKTFFKSGRGIVGEFFGQECHCRSFNSAIDFCGFTTKGIFIHGRMVEFFSWWMATPEKLEFALVINYATCVD